MKIYNLKESPKWYKRIKIYIPIILFTIILSICVFISVIRNGCSSEFFREDWGGKETKMLIFDEKMQENKPKMRLFSVGKW